MLTHAKMGFTLPHGRYNGRNMTLEKPMKRRAFLSLGSALALAACAPGIATTTRQNDEGEWVRASVYRIPAGTEARVQFRMLDSVNTLRQGAGLPPVELSAQLNAAAATHARDMSVQNRPWHFGSDGSSPLDRAARVGYPNSVLGENISETYETELETLAAWMDDPFSREVIMNPKARDMGFDWYQEPGGKLWWTMVMGG